MGEVYTELCHLSLPYLGCSCGAGSLGPLRFPLPEAAASPHAMGGPSLTSDVLAYNSRQPHAVVQNIWTPGWWFLF